jgi:hypothetical protein
MTSKTNSNAALGDVRSTSHDAASANVHGYVGTIEDSLAQIRAEADVARPYWPLNMSRERYELLGFLNQRSKHVTARRGPSVEMDEVNESSYGVPEAPVEPGFYTLAYAQKHFPQNFKRDHEFPVNWGLPS